jgi:hypothetical protein
MCDDNQLRCCFSITPRRYARIGRRSIAEQILVEANGVLAVRIAGTCILSL